MCFDKPKVETPAPTPTMVSTGESEAVKTARETDRRRQRSASGFSQNILAGAGGSDSKKSLLGQ